MQAIVVRTLGDPEVLRLEEIPTPQPAEGQVRVRLHVIGVNFADTERRRGLYDTPTLPWIPGNEAAGIVEALGPGVDSAWLGRRVAFWASRTSGSYADYTVVAAEALFALPDSVSFENGAALPLQGLTAYGLCHLATELRSGQTALIHAAAGGVGLLLIQLLRNRGVKVFGTASTEAKRALIREYGATPLAYGPDVPTAVTEANGGRGVDAVFDSVGRATQAESLASLAPYGHLVFFGEASGPPTPIEVGDLYARCLRVSAYILMVEPTAFWKTARQSLLDWMVAGRLKISLGRQWPLAQAAEAHRQLEGRQTSGKVLLLPG